MSGGSRALSDASPDIEQILSRIAGDNYCYLITTGRVTGQPHQVEIWFGLERSTLYLLSGGGDRSDWVRNIDRAPAVHVRIRKTSFHGNGRRITGETEESTARRLLAAKYQGWHEGQTMSEWARTALPIAVDILAADT